MTNIRFLVFACCLLGCALNRDGLGTSAPDTGRDFGVDRTAKDAGADSLPDLGVEALGTAGETDGSPDGELALPDVGADLVVLPEVGREVGLEVLPGLEVGSEVGTEVLVPFEVGLEAQSPMATEVGLEVGLEVRSEVGLEAQRDSQVPIEVGREVQPDVKKCAAACQMGCNIGCNAAGSCIACSTCTCSVESGICHC
jgi:hypothetical protein